MVRSRAVVVLVDIVVIERDFSNIYMQRCIRYFMIIIIKAFMGKRRDNKYHKILQFAIHRNMTVPALENFCFVIHLLPNYSRASDLIEYLSYDITVLKTYVIRLACM
jgi:hypothetical protein